jgi:hypothetical protein
MTDDNDDDLIDIELRVPRHVYETANAIARLCGYPTFEVKGLAEAIVTQQFIKKCVFLSKKRMFNF